MTTNALLSAHLRENHIAHTYLFTGPEDEAKDEMVLAFARALNCEKEVGAGPRACPGRGRPENEQISIGQPRWVAPPCDCSSCKKIENRTHPDVRWLGEDEKERSIKIEQIRDLIHESSLKPFEGRWKVFILKGAERLTLEASNALLKTLEEPPAHSVFLLLVENKAHLLETIQSRGFEIRTPPAPEPDPREDERIRILEEKGLGPFCEKLQGVPRPELKETLGRLLLYLRDLAVQEWEGGGEPAGRPSQSKRYLDALHVVYETQEALDANVNQKLALTYLEIQLVKSLRGTVPSEAEAISSPGIASSPRRNQRGSSQ